MHSKHIQIGKNLNSFGKLVKNKRIYQRGYGRISNRNYHIRRSQRGHGFGSVFAGLSRFLIPLITSGYNALKSEALSAGSDIINELKDRKVEDIVKNRGRQAIQNLKTKAVDKIDSLMTGSGSKKRKRSIKKSIKRQRTKKNPQILNEFNRIRSGGKIIIKSKLNRKKIKQKRTIKDIFG